MLRFCSLCFACCAVLLAHGPAHAQSSGAEREPEGYRAAIDTAVQEYELNHFAEAREHFARAQALFPNARALRGLGTADFELRHYVDAVQELEAALAAPIKRLEGTLRRDTEALLARARGYVGETRFVLDPADATISVDGVVMALDAQARLMLEVGDHQLEVSAPARVTQRLPLRVRGQQTTELRVTLLAQAPGEPGAASAAEPAAQTSVAAAPAAPSPRRRRVVTWILGGVTVAAAGTLLGLALAVEDTHDSFTACVDAAGSCQHLADKGTRLERARNAMIGVASAAAVATLVSFFIEGKRQRATHVALRVSPLGASVLAAF